MKDIVRIGQAVVDTIYVLTLDRVLVYPEIWFHRQVLLWQSIHTEGKMNSKQGEHAAYNEFSPTMNCDFPFMGYQKLMSEFNN